MVVFDNWKFREILKNIVEKKKLNGDRISSKQQLYMRIGEELHVSPETVKYWQRDKSQSTKPIQTTLPAAQMSNIGVAATRRIIQLPITLARI